MKKLIALILAFSALTAAAQYTAADSIQAFHNTTVENSGAVPQEMIYLHLDNTSYYRGDRIYFACYLVTSGELKPSNLSQTVYVELLNPSGKVIDKCVLKAVDGRCHGSLLANEAPFYSGYYEIRAYTRYMLNFGEEAIFSRVIPIYNEDHSMLKYGAGQLAFNRPKPAKTEKVNANFYPESGHLVAGLPSTVAFELTDEMRRPIDGDGQIIDAKDNTVVAEFATSHRGRGTFEFTPQAGHKYKAKGKDFSIELPAVESEGINLTVKDNMITVRRTENFPAKVVGVSMMCRGELCSRAILDLTDEPTASFGIPRKKLPTGAIQVTIFDTNGNVLADRLFFNNKHDYTTATYEFDKSQYIPFEPIDLTVKLSRPTPFSISVTDAENQVEYGSSLLADMLLASEIKGYVHNPAWYFEGEGREDDLDNLLMLQGWRRYPWRHLAGFEAVNLENMPEQGIEVHGTVLNSMRNKPIADAPMSMFLQKIHRKLYHDVEDNVNFDTFSTDSLGRFSFRVDVDDEWLMLLSVMNKGKMRPSRIMLDVNKTPESRRYDKGEMFAPIAETPLPALTDTIVRPEDEEAEIVVPNAKRLKEVTVTAKAPEDKAEQYRNTSIASYDIEEAHDVLRDRGKKYIRTLTDLLPILDGNFTIGQEILYKGKQPVFVIDYDFVANYIDYDVPAGTMLEYPLEVIKSVYINTGRDAIQEWGRECYALLSPKDTPNDFEKIISCVVFIEFYEHKRVKPVKGMRRSPLHGYTTPEEFYSPDYSEAVPDEDDYRRTLYWNPSVEPDSTGTARVRFYNNSTARTLNITTAAMPGL